MDANHHMKEALTLAKKGLGKTSPNPMVGAVIVKDGKIVGKGYHKKVGELHAEIIAINEAKKNLGTHKLNSCLLYVNLEPCCHWGKTPPCTQEIMDVGIKEVHTSIIDPAPWVNGKGIEQLQKAGIKVIVGESEEEAIELNYPYLKWVKTGIPFVILKAAITIDGKIAKFRTDENYPKWITNELSRKFVHKLRAQVDAVMVGIGTVIADDPELTVRLVKGKSPKRIILDSNIRIPHEAKVLGNNCIIASVKNEREVPQLVRRGAEIWKINSDENGRVSLWDVLSKVGKAGIQSLLIEGGKEVFTEALSKGVVDKVYFFVAPKLIGNGIPVIRDIGKMITLSSVKFRKFGMDILIEGRIPSIYFDQTLGGKKLYSKPNAD